MPTPRIALVSGHTDLSQEDFETHYIPQLQEALQNGDQFLLGDANGVDTQTLDFLLAPIQLEEYPNMLSRITIHASRIEHISRLKKLDVKVISPQDIVLDPSEDLDDLIGVSNKGKDQARYKHMLRDAYRTLHSDYDILYARSEEESRAFYGPKWRPRISATEMNWQRRENLKARAEGVPLPFRNGRRTFATGEKYVGGTREENVEILDELPGL